MNILVAIDSFKDSLSSQLVAESLSRGLSTNSKLNIEIQKISDGGEGALDVILDIEGFIEKKVEVSNPIGDTILALYAINSEKKIAFIEMAKAAGIELLSENNRNPLYTTSYGVGQIILDAYNKGIKEFIISIGGSATNDGGIGLLSALGVSFIGVNNKNLSNSDMNNISEINTDNILINKCKFKILVDVDNPLLGINGATQVYAQQKGAKKVDLLTLENNLSYYANILENYSKRYLRDDKGSGAAGGIAFGMKNFFDTETISGASELIKLSGLENKIDKYDLIITGEGNVDSQSLNGKLISGIADLCLNNNKPFILVGGNVDSGISKHLKSKGCINSYSLVEYAKNKKDSIKRSSELLEIVGREIATKL